MVVIDKVFPKSVTVLDDNILIYVRLSEKLD